MTTTFQTCKRFKHIIDNTTEIQYKIELTVAGLSDNEHGPELPISDRLKTLKCLCRSRKSPKGTWKPVYIGDWVNDLFNVRYYENMWVRCRKEGSLPRGRWNSVQCVCWEPLGLRSGGVVSDTWTLAFDFSFECFGADPGRDVLYLLDTRSVPGRKTYRCVEVIEVQWQARK